jgi:hypothetical protein
MKGGADDLTGPAAIAFVSINFNGFNDLFFLLTRHGCTSLSFSAGVVLDGASPVSE